MLVLFDHGTPRGLARALQGHTVKEARAQGWDTLSNGDLLNAAEKAGFDSTSYDRHQSTSSAKLARLQTGDRDSPQKPVESGAPHDAADCQRGERYKARYLHGG